MCGRAKLEGDVSEIKIAFRVPPEYPTPNFPPSWNVAPTDRLPIVCYDQRAGHRTLDLMRWGLIPYWAKDIKIGFSTINAMAETVDMKPVFRGVQKPGRSVDCNALWRPVFRSCRDRTRRPQHHGRSRTVGDMALSSPGDGTELHDHHDDAERAVR